MFKLHLFKYFTTENEIYVSNNKNKLQESHRTNFSPYRQWYRLYVYNIAEVKYLHVKEKLKTKIHVPRKDILYSGSKSMLIL